MDSQVAQLLFIIAAALVLFSWDRFPADVVALGVMLTLIMTGLLTIEQAFAGFGSTTVLMIFGLLILTAALVRTGVVELAGRLIFRHIGDQPGSLLIIIMVSSAVLGAFMSNTASTAFFLPIVIGLAQRTRTSPSRLLMPLAFSSILTSSVTLISTSTNIVISGMLIEHNLAPMGMFELAPVGIPVAITGLVYMFFIGQKLIPDRSSGDDSLLSMGVRLYLTEVIILPGSPLIDKTMAESSLGQDLDLNVLRIVRDKTRYLEPFASTRLLENDVLMVEGARDDILRIKDTAGIDIKADVRLSDPDLQTDEMALVEVILLPRSPLIGRTLKGLQFRESYSLQVLALNRSGETIRRKISQIQLRVGDVLLVQGRHNNIHALEQNRVFSIITAVDHHRPNMRRAPRAIAIFMLVIGATAFNLIPFAVAALLGVLAVFLTRCITPEEAYREIEWKVVILIGAMLSIGTAMQTTGTAEYIAGQFIAITSGTNPLLLLAGFFVLTVLLTQPMSNQAAAVVVLPVALQSAVQLGLNPRTFAMMIAVAASCSYLTPLEPSCLMVYGPGRYKFADFLRVGSLLTLVIFSLAMFIVPLLWPL